MFGWLRHCKRFCGRDRLSIQSCIPVVGRRFSKHICSEGHVCVALPLTFLSFASKVQLCINDRSAKEQKRSFLNALSPGTAWFDCLSRLHTTVGTSLANWTDVRLYNVAGRSNVSLRRGPSDGALEAMINPTLWSTLRSHPRSRSCPPRTRHGVGTGATRTRSVWSRKAIKGIGRSQRQRGVMASAVRF